MITQPTPAAVTAGSSVNFGVTYSAGSPYTSFAINGWTITGTGCTGLSMSGSGVGAGKTATVTGTAPTAAGSYTCTMTATSGDANAGTTGYQNTQTFTLTVNASTANKLVLVQGPSNVTAGSAMTPAPTVQVEDQYGNPVNDSGVNVTLTPTPTTSSFSGNTATTSAGGLATFSNLVFSAANNYTVKGSGGSLTATASSSSFTVSKAAPTLAAAGPSAGQVGTAIPTASITATLASSSGSNAGGSISFKVFAQTTAPSTCTSGGTPVGAGTGVTGDGTYSPTATYTPSAAGNLWWYASYGGDTNNSTSASTCGSGMSETVVGKDTPALTVSGPSTGTVGTTITAGTISATLSSGTNPTGTVTFTVFGPQATAPTTCTSGGTPVGTSSVSGNSTYNPSSGYTPTSSGNYWWYASFADTDGNNTSATSPCGATMSETVVAKVSPAFSSTGPSSGTAGASVTASSISASLSGGSSPTGTVTFTVFGPQSTAPTTCTSGGTTVGTSVVSGNGTYHPSTGYTPTTTGNYWWYASYGGDGGNNAASSTCGSGMAEMIVGKASPSLTTSEPSTGVDGTTIAASSISAVLGSTSGSNAGGTVTFTVFGPQSTAPTVCTTGGTPVGTSSVSGNNTYVSPAAFTPSATGNYWWYASYGGDGNNGTAASTCGGSMSETIVAKASPTLTVSVTGSYAAGSTISTSSISSTLSASSGANDQNVITFTVFGPQTTAPTSCPGSGTTEGSVTPSGNGTYHPTASFVPTQVGTYWWYVSSPPDANNNAASSTCGSGMASTVVIKASPSVSASAPSTGTVGVAVPASNISSVIASSSGPGATGTISFMVFGPVSTAPTNCSTGGTQIGTGVAINGNGTYHPTTGFTTTTPGAYWWYTTYNGDANNVGATSVCGSGMSETVISPGAATQLSFLAQPSNTLAGATMSPAVTVQVEDAYGNAVADNGLSITMTPSSGSITAGAVASTGATGLASFPIVMNTAVANVTLNAAPTSAGTGITGAVSNTFTISVLTGAGSTLSDAATDAASGVQTVAYYYCTNWSGSCTSSNWTAVNTPSTNSSATGPAYTVTWNTNLPVAGDYQVVAVGTDNVNNASSASASIPVTVSSPVLATNAANPVGSSTATLNGSVNAEGDTDNVKFCYATTQSLVTTCSGGTVVSASPATASGTSTTPESASLTGLSGTYYFNIEATNSGGATYYGTPQSFTTSVTVSKTTAGTFTLTVPAHVTSFGFTMDGAGGGGGSSNYGGVSSTAGGDGGSVSGTITIPDSSSPTTFTVVVGGGGGGGASTGNNAGGGAAGSGGAGCAAGGVGGGGNLDAAGAGGGATCLYLQGAPTGTIIEVAGGGGGGGHGVNGGDGSGGPAAGVCGTSTGQSGTGGTGVNGGPGVGGNTVSSGSSPCTVTTNTGGTGGSTGTGETNAGGTGGLHQRRWWERWFHRRQRDAVRRRRWRWRWRLRIRRRWRSGWQRRRRRWRWRRVQLRRRKRLLDREWCHGNVRGRQ